jgi:DNA-binding XRE family transcriptional regulator
MARPFGTRKYESVGELQSVIEEYFDFCDENEKPYTMSGLALALGISRQTLINYSKDENYFDTIKNAKQLVEMQLEENALSNKTNSTFTIFNLKNNFNWKDKTEVETNKEQLNKVEELLTKIKEEANDNN